VRARHTRCVGDDEWLARFEQLADVVRHPVLTLDLFTRHHRHDASDESFDDEPFEDDPDDEAIAAALDPDELRAARRRRGALMFAANVVFDRILDDLVISDEQRKRLGEERFVDEYLPTQYRQRYDAPFLRKLLATAAKVSQDLATADYSYPGCTAEELVLSMIVQQWQVLLDLTELGQSWTDLSEYLFEDTDFEYLFEPEMDGVENDPLVHKTSGIEVNPIGDWFVPFNADSRVHPYAIDMAEREPTLFDLTHIDANGDHVLTRPIARSEMPSVVEGLDPVSDLVAVARRDSRTHRDADEWIPDEIDAARSFAQLASRPIKSGVLTLQAGPEAVITEVPVLSFTPHPAHPATGTAWAEVLYFHGRTELPLAAVVSFRPDPGVRERWEAVFKPLAPDS
jgi:hypothetical protein